MAVGMFDPSVFSQLTDPNYMAQQGELAALAQAAQPRLGRMGWGADLTSALAALPVGAQAGRQQAMQNLRAQLQNSSALLDYRLKSAALSPFIAQLEGQNGTQPANTPTPETSPSAPNAAQSTPSENAPPKTSLFGSYYDQFLAPAEGGYKANDGNGAPVKFGINQGDNPDLDVSKLTPDQAKTITYQRYWKPSGADMLSNPALATVQADTAFNMGIGPAFQLLQASGGDPAKYLALRAQRYQQIAQADPTKAQYLKTWLARNDALGQYVSGFTPQPGNPQPSADQAQQASPGTPGAPKTPTSPTDMTGMGSALAMRMLFPGDRYQTMRNGWAYDKWSNQWTHFPDLGTGVTGQTGPDGRVTASVVPGELEALGNVQNVEEGVKANYKPMVVHDAAGNAYTVPASALAGALSPGAPGTAQPQSAAPATAAVPAVPQTPARPAAAAVPGAPPGTPQTPVQASALGIPTNLDDFLARLGPNYRPPMRPQGPPGSFLGEPGEGLEQIQKMDAGRLEQYSNEAAGGQKVYTNIEQMYQILQRGLNTGNATEAATHLASLAHQAGYDNLIPKGFDPSNANAFNKLATDLVFAQLKQIGGRPMVSEIEGLKRANPSLVMTPEANTEILNNVLADQRWKDARADLARQYMTRYGSLGDFDARFNEAYPEVDAFNKVTQIAHSQGLRLPGDASQGQAVLPPMAQRQVGKVYQTPRGPMVWMKQGNQAGWVPAPQQ